MLPCSSQIKVPDERHKGSFLTWKPSKLESQAGFIIHAKVIDNYNEHHFFTQFFIHSLSCKNLIIYIFLERTRARGYAYGMGKKDNRL